VSKNTIQKDLTMIENILKRYNISLIVKRNVGIALMGNEFNIRQAMIDLNNTYDIHHEQTGNVIGLDSRISVATYEYLAKEYPDFDLVKLCQRVKNAEEELGVLYTDISFSQIIEYLAVTLRRIKLGNIIKDKGSVYVLFVDETYRAAAHSILKDFVKCSSDLTLEEQFLGARLFVLRTFKNPPRESAAYCVEIAKQFMEKIDSVLSITGKISNNHELLHDLSLFFERVAYRNSYQMLIWDEIHRDVKERYPNLYFVCLASLFEIEEELNFVFSQDDIAWVVMLINNATSNSAKKYMAWLVTASDSNTSKYIAQKIEANMMNLQVDRVIDLEQFKKEDQTKLPTIISTIGLPGGDYCRISNAVSSKDLELILKFLEDHNHVVITKDVFKEVFSDKLILLELNAKDKQEVLSRGCELLVENGFVTKEFESKIWERENSTPTSIGDEIAIPHGYKEHVIKSGVAVIRLKHSVEWTSEDRVKLIFIIAFNFNRKEDISQFFKRFYELFGNHERVNALKHSTSTENLIEILLTN
jgi:lichenan operon transcriptional antiterminator